jgi:endonuclease/exonuclease/phosphatase (EEP) superfamily protein YafD
MRYGLAALEDVTAHHYGTTTESSSGVVLKEMALFGTYQGFRIGTTHVRVTQQGSSTPEQRATVTNLIGIAQQEAATHGGLLLTGDFNAPRGRATFDLMAEAFLDGVPPHYTTSLDGSLHRAGPLPYMVDCLFHTPTYKLENAALHTGVSDHCALITNLSKT